MFYIISNSTLKFITTTKDLFLGKWKWTFVALRGLIQKTITYDGQVQKSVLKSQYGYTLTDTTKNLHIISCTQLSKSNRTKLKYDNKNSLFLNFITGTEREWKGSGEGGSTASKAYKGATPILGTINITNNSKSLWSGAGGRGQNKWDNKDCCSSYQVLSDSGAIHFGSLFTHL